MYAMLPPSDRQIAHLRGLIARAEERVQKVQTNAKPGSSRMVHALTNSIRKHRRELHKRLAHQPEASTQESQLRQQRLHVQQVQRDSSADRNGDLLERQDQEPRRPASRQGAVAGQ
jgi:hypothetical protein